MEENTNYYWNEQRQAITKPNRNKQANTFEAKRPMKIITFDKWKQNIYGNFVNILRWRETTKNDNNENMEKGKMKHKSHK